MAEESRGGYLVTEADGTTHLPTRKNGKVDRGLCGAAWAALHSGYRGQKYQGPNKAEAIRKLTAIYKAQGWDLPGTGASEETAASMDDQSRLLLHSAGADVVYRTGLIFRAGDYPDKGLAITDADLAAVVANFAAPVEAELEHINTLGIKTFLDGKLGRLVAIWQQGAELFGQLAVPAWLDPLWAEAGRKVSVVWSEAGPAIKRIGLVLDPRVEDAQVMSALATFAAGRQDTPAGQSMLQGIHDLAARSGAICAAPPGAGFVSAHESTGLQAIHDLSTAHGAACPGMGAQGAGGAPSAFAGSRHSRADAADIQQIHDLAERQGAACASGAGGGSSRGRSSMSLAFWRRGGRRFRDEARAEGISSVPDEEVFSRLDEAEQEARAVARAEVEAAFAERLAAAEGREQQVRDELFRVTAQRLQSEAASFADGLITAGKLYPAEREALIAQYTQAGLDDATHGVVTFANGASGSRVEQITAAANARPAHGLTTEQLAHAPFSVVPGGQASARTGPAAMTRDELLATSPAGRAALARRAAGGNSGAVAGNGRN